ncbi:hypothetical protein ACOSP7_028247 [Xanthoceras sorbifolium]
MPSPVSSCPRSLFSLYLDIASVSKLQDSNAAFSSNSFSTLKPFKNLIQAFLMSFYATREALDSYIGHSRCDVTSRRSAQPISDARPVPFYTITIKIEPISLPC